jgi:hypothetical protein
MLDPGGDGSQNKNISQLVEKPQHVTVSLGNHSLHYDTYFPKGEDQHSLALLGRLSVHFVLLTLFNLRPFQNTPVQIHLVRTMVNPTFQITILVNVFSHRYHINSNFQLYLYPSPYSASEYHCSFKKAWLYAAEIRCVSFMLRKI